MKRIISVFLILLLLVSCGKSEDNFQEIIEKISISQIEKNPSPTFSQNGGEWNIIGLKRANYENNNYYKHYLSNLEKVLIEKYGDLGRKSTEYSRVVLALCELNENPYDFRSFDLITPLTDFDYVVSQGVNGAAYALLALQNNEDTFEICEKYKQYLIKMQKSDGGFSIMGDISDPNTTAMVLQSVAVYKNEEKILPLVENALNFLSNSQNSNGGFDSFGEKGPECASQVIIALSKLDFFTNDERFIKEKSLLDNILSFYKNGEFSHTLNGSYNSMATEQGLIALTYIKEKTINE